jgi:hypothetical protein
MDDLIRRIEKIERIERIERISIQPTYASPGRIRGSQKDWIDDYTKITGQ